MRTKAYIYIHKGGKSLNKHYRGKAYKESKKNARGYTVGKQDFSKELQVKEDFF